MANDEDTKPAGPPRPIAAKVPDALRPAFEKAQEAVHEFFSTRSDDPHRGSIDIGGERYVLMRAASLSNEFVAHVAQTYRDHGDETGIEVAQGVLFDMAHAMGMSDARSYSERSGVSDPIERLSAGPLSFAYAGWALVDIHPTSHPSPDDDFFLSYDHPNSFEAESWLKDDGRTTSPVCIMSSGYSSGWCEASFEIPLVAVEISCRAAGDEHCRFIMAPPSRIEEHLTRLGVQIRGDGPESGATIPEFFQGKRIEDERRRNQDELERRIEERTRELREANERLRREAEERAVAEATLRQVQKMEAVGTLAGGIAHDFNNLLTAIIAGLQLAQLDSDPDTDLYRVLQSARQASFKAAEMTRQLVTLSRKQPSQILPTDPNGVVRTIAELLQRSTPIGITVSVELSDDVGSLELDEGKIHQALLNLGINAVDAMPKGGQLTIRTSPYDVSAEEAQSTPDGAPGRHLRIDVIDTGTGIEKRDLEHVFEPFFTTKQVGRGTGLGLASVYGATRDHGGWISVDTEVGRGTTFSMFIPWRPAGPDDGERPSTELRRGDETILIVDDTDNVRGLAKAILDRCGYKTIIADAGESALLRFDEHSDEIDLVITDMVMPGMTGNDLLAALRKRGCVAPIILASGNWAGDQLPNEGFAAILRKPFDGYGLANVVRDILDSQPSRSPSG